MDITPWSLEKGFNPLKLGAFEVWLQGYPNAGDRVYLYEGFKFGSHIPFQGPRVHFMANSLRFIKELENICLREKNIKEIKEVWVLGSFLTLPLPILWVSLLGIMSKKAPGEYSLKFTICPTPGVGLWME